MPGSRYLFGWGKRRRRRDLNLGLYFAFRPGRALGPCLFGAVGPETVFHLIERVEAFVRP